MNSSNNQNSTKDKFETQLAKNGSGSKKMPKAAKKRAKRSMPKMKSDITYESVLQTTSSDGKSNSKSKPLRSRFFCR